jgi:hypothetical protein|tara:strand:+ start:27737 stop:28843 length:1107 start_codon:yes stop_codon:yes gene_type:complete
MATLKVDYSDGDIWYAGNDLEAQSGINAVATQINTNTTNITSNDTDIAKVNSALGGRETVTIAQDQFSINYSIKSFTNTTFIKTVNSATYTGTLSSGNIAWSVVDDQVTNPEHMAQADDDVTDIIIMKGDGYNSFSTNSGGSFTASSTIPDNVIAIKGLSYATGGAVAVCVGEANSLRGAWYTSNGGADWAQATSGAAHFICVDMFSATTGFAVDNSGNVYKTTDGGEGWDDTGGNVNGDERNIIALTATTYVTLTTDGNIYTGSGGTATQRIVFNYSHARVSEILKLTNGNLYYAVMPNSTATVFSSILLCKSTDSGITWSVKNIAASGAGLQDWNTNYQNDYIAEYDTNKIIILTGRAIYTLDESA